MTDVPDILLFGGWVISTIAAGVGSVGLWNWLIRREDRREERKDRSDDRLREEHRECLERVDHLEDELRSTQERLAVVEAHHGSLVARWIKDANRRVCWANGRAMATIFGPLGYSRVDVEGRTFHELTRISPEAAHEIDRLDRAALAYPGMAVASTIRLAPDLPLMVIVKVAGVSPRDQELIFEGHAWRDAPETLTNDLAAERAAEARCAAMLRLDHGRSRETGDD
jgi:hypothetical protein